MTSSLNRPYNESEQFLDMNLVNQSASQFKVDVSDEDLIPTFHLTDEQCKNPIKFIESVYEQGKQFGAIKVKLSENYQKLLNSNINISQNMSFKPKIAFPGLHHEKESKFNELIHNHWNFDKPEPTEIDSKLDLKNIDLNTEMKNIEVKRDNLTTEKTKDGENCVETSNIIANGVKEDTAVDSREPTNDYSGDKINETVDDVKSILEKNHESPIESLHFTRETTPGSLPPIQKAEGSITKENNQKENNQDVSASIPARITEYGPDSVDQNVIHVLKNGVNTSGSIIEDLNQASTHQILHQQVSGQENTISLPSLVDSSLNSDLVPTINDREPEKNQSDLESNETLQPTIIPESIDLLDRNRDVPTLETIANNGTSEIRQDGIDTQGTNNCAISHDNVTNGVQTDQTGDSIHTNSTENANFVKLEGPTPMDVDKAEPINSYILSDKLTEANDGEQKSNIDTGSNSMLYPVQTDRTSENSIVDAAFSVKTELNQTNIPLNPAPTLNNRTLNFYELYSCVKVFGGFHKVNNMEYGWLKVCHEMDMELTSAEYIKEAYLKYIQPLEAELKDIISKENVSSPGETSIFMNMNGKRTIETESSESKRVHSMHKPVTFSSSERFLRSVKSKLLKGFPLSCLDVEPKTSPTLSAQNYFNHILKFIVENKEEFLDESDPSYYTTLNEYIRRDLELLKHIPALDDVNLKDNKFLSVALLDDIILEMVEKYEPAIKVGAAQSKLANFGFIRSNETMYNSQGYHNQASNSSSNPWNLHNLSIIPDSLLGSMAEADLMNPSFGSPKLQIGGSFTFENWSYQDHFSQLANFHLVGAEKVWYFIPEKDHDKFEQLKREYIPKHGQNVGRSFRFNHVNPAFQNLMKETSHDSQTVFITPQLLKELGLTYYRAVQNPGEFIFQYPKSHSFSTSLGFNVSEEVNFVTKCWLNYASQAEELMSSEGIMPNFLVFKMLINLIQVFDSGKNIAYGSDVYMKIQDLYDELCTRELDLRQEVRKLKIKESIIDEKGLSIADAITDVDLRSGYPSRITITDKKEKSKISMSLDYFLSQKEALINSKNFTIQLNLFHSDEKLRNFSRIIANYSVDFDKWLEEYEETMKSAEHLSLKTYKTILADGEKIASAAKSVADKNSKSYLKFKKSLSNLKQFILNSNQYIEECQNLLAIKHQQRIRNNTEYERASLTDLVRLIDTITSLNFSSTDTDQILELQQEIENFDKASRVLISKKNKSTQEFNDLINLGESFGIEIPSLNFITRIRDRLKWIKMFNLIEKGADPFSDKKEVFSLENLHNFYDEGKRILAEEDLEIFKSVQGIVHDSVTFDQEVTLFLQYKSIDMIDLKTLDKIAERIRLDKIFISSENYQKLSKLHLNAHFISQLQEFKSQEKFPYWEVKQLQNSLTESGLRFDSDSTLQELVPSETWVNSIWDIAKDVTIVSTMDKSIDLEHLNLRVSLNLGLVEKLYQMCYKAEQSFSTEDIFENSSAYLLKNPNDEARETPIYCTCREYEFGTMIECDSCNEWYHVSCVDEEQKEDGEGNYKCPVCKFIDSQEKIDKFLKKQFRFKTMGVLKKEGDALRAYPENEKKAFDQLYDQCHEFQISFQNSIEKIRKGDKSIQQKIDNLKFFIRKMYGSGILMADQLRISVKLVRDYQRELNPPIELHNPPFEPFVNDSTAFGNLLAAATIEIDKGKDSNHGGPIRSSTPQGLHQGTFYPPPVFYPPPQKPQNMLFNHTPSGAPTFEYPPASSSSSPPYANTMHTNPPSFNVSLTGTQYQNYPKDVKTNIGSIMNGQDDNTNFQPHSNFYQSNNGPIIKPLSNPFQHLQELAQSTKPFEQKKAFQTGLEGLQQYIPNFPKKLGNDTIPQDKKVESDIDPSLQ